ncbi:MAG: hypothetical protein GC193_03435 [Cryomorphaceae bacterium]|nr:hypothetical protein [Cryomorphaceae bacterium]
MIASMNVLRYLSLVAFFLSSLFAQAQISGKVVDDAGKPLAFVTVLHAQSQQGTYTDIDGKFLTTVGAVGDKLVLTYIGFERKEVVVTSNTMGTIKMKDAKILLDEAVVEAGENPAEGIMRKVIANKDRNNPEKQGPFSYDAYNKLVFTALVDSAAEVSTLDSSEIRMREFLNDQHILLMESFSERKYFGPGRDSETVKASRFSGLSNPEFVLLGTQLQSFSFYNDEVALLDTRYVSPLNDLAIRKYLFIIEDTTYIAADTVFILSFRPRTGKNFAGISGVLYINAGDWALRNVLANPVVQTGGVEINIRQLYEHVDGKSWFPVQLNTDLAFKNVSVNNSFMIGIGRSYISNIVLGDSLRRRDVNRAALVLDPLATKQPEDIWNTYRNQELDEKELRTYTFMDSLSKAEGFDRKMRFVQALSSGKLRLGVVNADLDRLLRYNDFEGFRLGAGVHTNERISRVFTAGGYFAYGFKDKQWKGGGDLTFNIRPLSNTTSGTRVYRDVFERGGTTPMTKVTGFDATGYLDLFINRMDRLNVAEAFFRTDLGAGLSTEITARTGQLQLQNSTRMVIVNEPVRLYYDIIDIEELELGLRWSFREKIVQTPTRRMTVASPFPVVSVNAIAGRTGFSDEPYTRLAAQIDYTVKMSLLGNFSVRLAGGQLQGPAPSFRFFALRGSKVDWSVATPFGFETLKPGSMLPTRFAAIHLRHDFKDLLFKRKKFAPHPVIVHNMAIGEYKPEETFSGLIVTAPEKGYIESGLAMEALLRSGFTTLGLGAFYNYGPGAAPSFNDNIVYKIAVGIAF